MRDQQTLDLDKTSRTYLYKDYSSKSAEVGPKGSRQA